MDAEAPGAPGIPPRWTSSAKSGVGTALNPMSRVWFTLSHGIFNEVYYPRLDQICVRDMGSIVTDGREFFSEEKRHTRHGLSYLAEGVPAYRLVNDCLEGRYRIEKEVLTDPEMDAVLQSTRFVPLIGSPADYHLYVLLAASLGNHGSGNTAWVDDYKGTSLLMAEREGVCLALACSSGWRARSVGFVGVSDGWQDLRRHGLLTRTWSHAGNGNVALTGEVDLAAGGSFLLALGFGFGPAEAALRARAGLLKGIETCRARYVAEWRRWQGGVAAGRGGRAGKGGAAKGGAGTGGEALERTSLMVLRVHEAKSFSGGLIASLSVPWGTARGDEDLGGYHLVWPRDLVEAAGGLLAAGAGEDARRVVRYLEATQESDGHWPQNMWMDGRSYWSGIQMDETALCILLVDLAGREGAIAPAELRALWPMMRRAAAFIVRDGPVTRQDRWEEDAGYTPFTLSAEIAALLIAAEYAERYGEPGVGRYLGETADAWNASIERWIYVSDTPLARRTGVPGYYVRVTARDTAEAASPAGGFVPIKNRPPDQAREPAEQIVSPDALALVRFGLRAADDPRILSTLAVVDALLRLQTPAGPVWHRYTDDGYGEHEDGRPFDGTGVGRAWPLLTGERGHYELAAGRGGEARRLLQTMEGLTNDGGLLPEQVWDAADIPERELFFGRPSGSAMPLVWAHAEYLKLARSLRDGRVFDLPPQTVKRYLVDRTGSPFAVWRCNFKILWMQRGRVLRLEVPAPAIVRWSVDGWGTARETPTRDPGLGVHAADLPTEDLPAGAKAAFTFRWLPGQRWEGRNFEVEVRNAQ